VALVANPRSGGKNTTRSVRMIEERLKAKRIQVDLYMTRYHGHALELVKTLDIKEVDAVVSAGGDGTNYQVLNGLLKYHGNENLPPMGIIPLGRGNSFARDLPVFNIEEGISALCRQTMREVDVCRFTQNGQDWHFVNLMGWGFVTDVAKTAARCGWAGNFSYVIGVFYHTLGLNFHRMTLEIDDQVITGQNCFVEICNSRYTGGDMLMAPDARIDDGWFDAVVTAPLNRWSLITTLPAIFKGTHGKNPAVRFIRGKRARIITEPAKALLPDGELFGTTPTEISILPRLVRYFC